MKPGSQVRVVEFNNDERKQLARSSPYYQIHTSEKALREKRLKREAVEAKQAKEREAKQANIDETLREAKYRAGHIRWLKGRMREISRRLKRAVAQFDDKQMRDEVTDVALLLSSLSSIARTINPAEEPELAEQALVELMERERADMPHWKDIKPDKGDNDWEA